MNPESYKSIIRALADPRAYDKAQREGGLCQYAVVDGHFVPGRAL